MPSIATSSRISVMQRPELTTMSNRTAVAGPLSPEFQLLCACCIWPDSDARAERISRLGQAALDWNYFLGLTERHRVHGLVFHAFRHLQKNSIPELVRGTIAEKAASLARQNLQLASESVRICRAMESAGICPRFLKGVLLALVAYGDLSLRHSKDIDLLVSDEAAFSAHRILTDAGYVGISAAEGMTTGVEVRRWFEHNRHIEYLHPTTGVNVELHVRMFANPLLNHPFGDESWQEFPLGGAKLIALQRNRMFLYMCVHGAVHGWFRLKWLADIAALLAQATPAEIEQLRHAAETNGILQPVLQAMRLSSLLGSHSLQSATSQSWRERWLVRVALHELSSELEPDANFRTTRIRLAPYLFRRDWRFISAQLRCDSFSEADRQLVDVPTPLSFLYLVIRPFTWIVRRFAKYREAFDRRHA